MTTLEYITARALYDHVKPVANNAVTLFKRELILEIITDAPSAVNDKN